MAYQVTDEYTDFSGEVKNFIERFHDNILTINGGLEYSSTMEKNNGKKPFKVILSFLYRNTKNASDATEGFTQRVLETFCPDYNTTANLLNELAYIISQYEFLNKVYAHNQHHSIIHDTFYFTNTDLLADILEYLMRVCEFSPGLISYITSKKALAITLKLDSMTLPKTICLPKIVESDEKISDYFKEIYFEMVAHYNSWLRSVEEEKRLILENAEDSVRLVYEVSNDGE